MKNHLITLVLVERMTLIFSNFSPLNIKIIYSYNILSSNSAFYKYYNCLLTLNVKKKIVVTVIRNPKEEIHKIEWFDFPIIPTKIEPIG